MEGVFKAIIVRFNINASSLLLQNQANFNIRKGKSKRAPTILNTKSSVNPMIRKGRRISHISGKRIIISRAIGQHNTKSKAHNTTPRKSRMQN
jgi:hypothetical protein